MEKNLVLCVILKNKSTIFKENFQNVKSVTSNGLKTVSMLIKIEYQFNKKSIMNKIEINYYKNKTITETKETQTLKNYIDLILNYKKNKALEKKSHKQQKEK